MARAKLKYTLVNATTLQWTIPEGEAVVLDMTKVSTANTQWAAIHGFKRRVADGAALERNKDTGASASWADKRAEMQAIVEHLESGTDQWRLASERGPRAVDTSELDFYVDVLALVYTEKSREALTAFAKKKSKVERMAHLTQSSAMKASAELLREQLSADVDLDSMEDELNAIE